MDRTHHEGGLLSWEAHQASYQGHTHTQRVTNAWTPGLPIQLQLLPPRKPMHTVTPGGLLAVFRMVNASLVSGASAMGPVRWPRQLACMLHS